MNALGALVRKEFLDVWREKSLVVAFLVQLFLAGFSTLLLTGLTALYSPEAVQHAPDVDVAYVGPGGFDTYMEEHGNLVVAHLDHDEALQRFREGALFAVVQEQDGDLRRVTLLLPDAELEATLVVTQLKSLLLDYERDLREQRQDRLETELVSLDTDVRPTRPYGFVYGTLLPLLIITPVFLSGAIAGDALSQESRTRTLLVLRSAPLSPGRLVVGKLLVPILLVPLQVLLWLGLFALNGFPSTQVGLLLATATLLGVLLSCLGTLVAVLVRDESATQAVYAVLVLLVAGLAMLLPRDPLNLFALLATGTRDAATVHTVAIVALAAVALGAAALYWTRRAVVRDLL